MLKKIIPFIIFGEMALCDTPPQTTPEHTTHAIRPHRTTKLDCTVPSCEKTQDRLDRFAKMTNNTTTKNGLSYQLRPRKTAPSRGSRSRCPLDKDEVGRATWSLLHTLAANYDFDSKLPPSEDSSPSSKMSSGEFDLVELQALRVAQAEHFTNIILGIAYLYPCEDCRQEFSNRVNSKEGRERLRKAVQTGREGVVKYVCEEHNSVRERIGGRLWDCDNYGFLEKRWGENGEC